MALTILALNCTLKSGSEASSTDLLLTQVLAAFAEHGGQGEIIRLANHNVLPGVTSDEGKGDDWPAIRAKIVAADILVLGTPIWMGQPGSIAKRVLERLDAFLSETDTDGRMPPMVRSPAPPSWATKTAPIIPPPRFSRRSTMSAFPSPPMP